MVDKVTVKAVLDTATQHVIQMTNESDGTGEAVVTKIDISALAAVSFRVVGIRFSTKIMGFKLWFEATVDELLIEVAGDKTGFLTFPSYAYMADPRAAGFTGDILLSTVGHAAGASYMIHLDLEKVTV